MIKKESLFDLILIDIIIIAISVGGWYFFNKFGFPLTILVFLAVTSIIFFCYIMDKDAKEEEEKEEKDALVERAEARYSTLFNIALLASCKDAYMNKDTVIVLKALFLSTIKEIIDDTHNRYTAEFNGIPDRLNKATDRNIYHVMTDVLSLSMFPSGSLRDLLDCSKQVKTLDKISKDTQAGLVRWEQMHGSDLVYRGYTEDHERPTYVISLDDKTFRDKKYIAIIDHDNSINDSRANINKRVEPFVDMLISVVQSELQQPKQTEGS